MFCTRFSVLILPLLWAALFVIAVLISLLLPRGPYRVTSPLATWETDEVHWISETRIEFRAKDGRYVELGGPFSVERIRP